MLKRIVSLVLVLSLFSTACFAESIDPMVPEFKGMNDPELLPYIEDTLYSELVSTLNSDGCFVENVSAVYISQEYLDELAFNSQANIFFGYTLAELDEQFQGTRYIFTLGENNETVVEPFETYRDETFEKVLKNVAIGAGIILICVTVSYATATAAPAVSMIFASAVEEGTALATSWAEMGFISAGLLHYVQTGNFDESIKTGLIAGSEGFKWGAIVGTVKGGLSETGFLNKWHQLTNIKWNEAAQIQRESGYSLDFIRTVHSLSEYDVYKKAGLIEYHVGDRRFLLPQNFDFNIVDPKTGYTNWELMSKGYNPVDANGIKYDWHHVGQKVDSPLALLTETQHQNNYSALHPKLTNSEVRPGGDNNEWDATRKALNKYISTAFGYTP